MTDQSPERQRRLIRLGLPALGALAAAALAAGALAGSVVESSAERTARSFTRAWQRGDFAAMHRLLTPEARSRHSLAAFRRVYTAAAATATATGVAVRDPSGESDGEVTVQVAVRTRVFGTLRRQLTLPMKEERVAWTPSLAFPGLSGGAALSRTSDPPERGRLLSRDGKVLAEGDFGERSSPLGTLSSSIAGSLGPEEAAGRAAVYARGFPRRHPVGQSGLERVFEERLAGRPGGELIAAGRVIARAAPRKAPPVRTTIDVGVQEAAVTALAGRFGGIAALDARNGEIRALAGLAFSAPQPPGSTFKIVTATAALEQRLVKPSDEFPVQTAAIIDGVELENANGESCGGSFRNSFAHSCNSVFGPLGVKVGAKQLVATAERYGFNARRAIAGELPSTLPPASEITSPLEVGSTAIGQGKVLATPLTMAAMAQTVAAGGVRTEPTLGALERPAPPVRVTTGRVARTLERLMIDVVAYGTGTAAAIPGVKVAGKTGTAELEDTRGPNAQEEPSDGSNTDAWFTSFAPAGRPRIAVAVLLVRAGAGGATAAPAARIVLEAGLRASRAGQTR